MYQTLLVQQSQANLNSSVPVNPIRIVEAAAPPEEPYKPKPVLNISFGTLFGIVLAGGIVFLRERMDRSIKTPGVSRRMFNAPELGVIPNLGSNGNLLPSANGRVSQGLDLNGDHEDDVHRLGYLAERPGVHHRVVPWDAGVDSSQSSVR